MYTPLVLVYTTFLILNNVYSMKYEDALSHIKNHVQSYSGDSLKTKDSLCNIYNCCTLSSTEACQLSELKKDTTNLIFPGGSTRCIFSTSTPYSFQVIPGDTDKLLVYYQGGGACWTKETTTAEFCTTDAKPGPLIGIFDRTNDQNQYKDYTIVQLLYCSGDVWGGNVTRDYTDSAGQPVVQVGQFNGQSTLNWIKQLQDTNQLSSTLSDLVIMGCSAGSIGAQIWGTSVLDALKWEKASIIPDSYAGIFPKGTQGPLVYDYGICSWDKLPSSLYETCMNQKLTLQDLNAVYQKQYSNIPFGFIQSKADAVQQSFYVAIGVSMNTTAEITPAQFYEDVNEVFGVYNKENPNFITYLVDGAQHCFTPTDILYMADGLGPSDNNSTDNTGIMMDDWVNNYPLLNGEETSTLCLGQVLSPEEVTKATDTAYCSSTVTPKEFIEKY